jgi:hypothetical protein
MKKMPIEYDYIDDEDDNEEEVVIDLDSEETEEIDVWEFALDDEDIDELIEMLKELKETKQHFHFDLDEANELVIHHAEEIDDEESEEEEE